jgi:hypothetical protein
MKANNKIIAEFMGDKPKELLYRNVYKDYGLSWDLLIPVVQKIEQDCEGVPQEMLNISLYSDINEVYKAVLTFIKNSQHEWR